jgi:hypothetical protein
MDTLKSSDSAKVVPCRICVSTKIIQDVRELEQGQHSDGYLQVFLYGDPNALIFKDRVYGQLRASICGNCGLTELRVINPEELYVKYLESKEKGNV